MSDLLTVEDLQARWKGCSVRTIERYRRQGLVALKINGVMFRLEDVEAFEESRLTGRPKTRRRQYANSDEMPKLKHLLT